MAVDTYGKLDGIVNNAGILRDAIFHRMSIDAFESVIKVHLMGSFYVSHAAARIFREQESGAFVHFTSTSGLIGNLGQANYAAAKLGIVGLLKSIALDMQRFNVQSNCISPFAWSRLIGTIPTETEAEKERVSRIQQMGPERSLRSQRSCLKIPPRTLPGRFLQCVSTKSSSCDSRGLFVQFTGAGLVSRYHRRARHAGPEAIFLQARPLGRRVQSGSNLAAYLITPIIPWLRAKFVVTSVAFSATGASSLRSIRLSSEGTI
jgi:hypothetical protein